MKDGSKSGRKLKELRQNDGKSQEQLSLDTFLSREAVSKFETGERKIQPSMTKHYIQKHNDPMLGFQAVSEYVGWHIDPLDGPAADMHRSSVHLKTMEEITEALEAMKECNITDNPAYIAAYEKENIKRTMSEVADAIHSLTMYMATGCKEFGFSWDELWDEHQRKLQSRGYVKA